MILREILNLSKSIADCRMNMYKLREDKGLSDPAVVKVSEKLESEIVAFQKIMYAIRSS